MGCDLDFKRFTLCSWADTNKGPKAGTIMVCINCLIFLGTRRPKTKVWALLGAYEGAALGSLQAARRASDRTLKLLQSPQPAYSSLKKGLSYLNVLCSQGRQSCWTRAHTHDLILT